MESVSNGTPALLARPPVPVWIRVLSLIVFLYGLISFLELSVIVFFKGPDGFLGYTSLLYLVRPVLLITLGVGFWKMKRWSLYPLGLFILFYIFGIAQLLLAGGFFPVKHAIIMGAALILFAYFWSTRSRLAP